MARTPRSETAGAAAAYVRAQAREQKRLLSINPIAPPSLLARVGRWFGATFTRELAWQLTLSDLLTLGLLKLVGGFRSRIGRLIAAAYAVALVVHLRHAITAHRSAAVVDEALEDLEGEPGPKMPLTHVAVPPLMFFARHRSVERGRVFAEPEGIRLRLDIYRPDDSIAGPLGAGSRRPAVIQVHGGGWLSGSRYEQGIPLLNHLASRGWVGFNIDYRLSPQATWPDHIVDVKSAIAWVRNNAEELGVDPAWIAITGGSAGGHLTALAGLSANDPDFQPGFEGADTSVCAAVPFYGIYDLTNESGHYYPELRDWAFEEVVFKVPVAENRELYERASPLCRIHADAPPFMVVHGDRDTLTPVGDARDFAESLRRASREEVRYIELPGAEHAFDLWPSVRTARVADGIGRFLTSIVTRERTEGARRPQPVSSG